RRSRAANRSGKAGQQGQPRAGRAALPGEPSGPAFHGESAALRRRKTRPVARRPQAPVAEFAERGSLGIVGWARRSEPHRWSPRPWMRGVGQVRWDSLRSAYAAGDKYMRTFLAETLTALAQWLRRKSMPSALAGNQWSGTSYVDAYKRNRQPTPNELLAELKGAAWTCASINAAVCASFPPKLYVATHPGQPTAKCPVKDLAPPAEQRLRNPPRLPAAIAKARQLQEVLDHPLLTLLRQVNPVHNSFDLWELTTLFQEVHGSAYWDLSFDAFGLPDEI